jgi:hypothetical protein
MNLSTIRSGIVVASLWSRVALFPAAMLVLALAAVALYLQGGLLVWEAAGDGNLFVLLAQALWILFLVGAAIVVHVAPIWLIVSLLKPSGRARIREWLSRRRERRCLLCGKEKT